jgi:GntR family histidine utilization transcriptional repressor
MTKVTKVSKVSKVKKSDHVPDTGTAAPVANAASPQKTAAISLHQRILDDIEQNILSGKWPPGCRIPSELELTLDYQCSRMTVNKVLTQLARANLIERRRKAGSFVMRSQSRSAVLEIQDIRTEVMALGLAYRYVIVDSKKRTSLHADIELLTLDAPGPVIELLTMHYAGLRPFCLERRLINLSAVPSAASADFADEAPGAWLVKHVPWTSAEHRIRAGAADAETAPALKVRRGTPCLVVDRRTWTGGKPVTFVRLTYPGEGHELVARFSPTHGLSSGDSAA